MFRASKFYSEMYLKETIRVTHKAIVANDFYNGLPHFFSTTPSPSIKPLASILYHLLPLLVQLFKDCGSLPLTSNNLISWLITNISSATLVLILNDFNICTDNLSKTLSFQLLNLFSFNDFHLHLTCNIHLHGYPLDFVMLPITIITFLSIPTL